MFIIQHNLMNEEQLNKMKSALSCLEIPHQFVGVIPFSREITSDVPLEGTNYLPYGSTLLTTLTPHWRGNYFIRENFHYRKWNSLRDDMLNDGVYTVAEAIEFFKEQPKDSVWFTRPCEDLKHYSGQTIEAEEGAAWLQDALGCGSSGTYKMEPDMEIIVARPKEILMEWRWFIVNHRVISGSVYRRKGQLFKKKETSQEVIAEAQEFANKWTPHRNCVMDLGLTADGQVKVIEFNTINSSGFYDNDVAAVIAALWEDFNSF